MDTLPATTITRMTADATKLMRLMSWLSPAFPIGAYSYSHGLERAVEAGIVHDRATLVDWLDADLRYGAGRADGIFFAQSWRATHDGGDLLAIAELAAAMRATAELALESAQQGVAFLTAVRKAWPHPDLERHSTELRAKGITPMLPVAAGIACGVHEIALEVALPLYLHAGAANLINAAVRLVPLGQTDGQMALAAMEAAVAQTAIEAFRSGLEDIGSAAFMIDIASMQHEIQYTRLFRS
jgi:urease accessory protein